MILDQLKNAAIYAPLSPRIALAFNYLTMTDFSQVALGKYEIDGDRVFAIVNEYETKDEKDCVLEAHKKYIDIHYTISGSEAIGTTFLSNQVPTKEYDEQNDYMLFNGETTHQILTPGLFALLYPHDIHSPGHHPKEKSFVRKVVMKVLI